MKFIKTFVAVAALSLFSAASFAQSVSATASTLDRAEAKIAAQAAEQGAAYNYQRPVYPPCADDGCTEQINP